jgi:hypothetical protein
MSYHGLSALQVGFLVAFTQLIPEHQVQVRATETGGAQEEGLVAQDGRFDNVDGDGDDVRDAPAQFLISALTLPLAARYLERVWGAAELVKFVVALQVRATETGGAQEEGLVAQDGRFDNVDGDGDDVRTRPRSSSSRP